MFGNLVVGLLALAAPTVVNIGRAFIRYNKYGKFVAQVLTDLDELFISGTPPENYSNYILAKFREYGAVIPVWLEAEVVNYILGLFSPAVLAAKMVVAKSKA